MPQFTQDPDDLLFKDALDIVFERVAGWFWKAISLAAKDASSPDLAARHLADTQVLPKSAR